MEDPFDRVPKTAIELETQSRFAVLEILKELRKMNTILAQVEKQLRKNL